MPAEAYQIFSDDRGFTEIETIANANVFGNFMITTSPATILRQTTDGVIEGLVLVT